MITNEIKHQIFKLIRDMYRMDKKHFVNLICISSSSYYHNMISFPINTYSVIYYIGESEYKFKIDLDDQNISDYKGYDEIEYEHGEYQVYVKKLINKILSDIKSIHRQILINELLTKKE